MPLPTPTPPASLAKTTKTPAVSKVPTPQLKAIKKGQISPPLPLSNRPGFKKSLVERASNQAGSQVNNQARTQTSASGASANLGRTPLPKTAPAILNTQDRKSIPAGLALESPGGKAPPLPSSAPVYAEVKQSPLKKFLPIILSVLLISGIVLFVISLLTGQKKDNTKSIPGEENKVSSVAETNQVVLNYWGLWEDPQVYEAVFADFEKENPGIKVNYRQQSHQDYRERLQTAIASGNGPDIFRFHASWTSMLSAELASMPSSVMSKSEYENTFYPVAVKQLQNNGQIVGIPLMYDALVLYYNKEILKAANQTVPTTWIQLSALANDLTIPTTNRSDTNIQRAGLAIGNTSNTEHYADILALLILQNGGNPAEPLSPEVKEALIFYTNFITTHKVWSASLPSSTAAFARGEVAMMIAPSWRYHEVKAMNPSLDFGIAPIPKLGDVQVTWASYWAEGINSKSPNQEAAWKLLKYLSSKEVMKKIYSETKQIRAFGEIYSRMDLAEELANDPILYPFIQDAKSAQSWSMCSYTHDKGINDQIIKYYEDAINAVIAGKSIDDVLATVDLGVKQVLRQYGGG